MARAAHARTREEHTYAKRFAPLLDEALRRKAARPPAAPAAVFEIVAARHPPSWWLRALRALLACPASLLFGGRRGPRAARRLLFELSWRLAGPATYSARGWPGRLFYRES
jgi:spore maturation protein CgeB